MGISVVTALFISAELASGSPGHGFAHTRPLGLFQEAGGLSRGACALETTLCLFSSLFTVCEDLCFPFPTNTGRVPSISLSAW